MDSFTLQQVADAITGGDLRLAAELVNDSHGQERLDEIAPHPAVVVWRQSIINMATFVGKFGRKACQFLLDTADMPKER